MTGQESAGSEWRTSSRLPDVSVVVCTRDRPQLLVRAVKAVLAQDYRGAIEVVVVFDRCDPEPLDVTVPEGRTVVITRNQGTPGLAGARNHGLATARGTLAAFCDDDDEWLPQKLTRQVDLLRANSDAVLSTCGIVIVSESGRTERVPAERLEHTDFLRSRVLGTHPSTFVFERRSLQEWGGVDEGVPHSYGEDYELLLRVTRYGCVVSVQEPLALIYWNRPSFFSGRWEQISGGLGYLLDRYPEFAEEPRGRARVRGQVAFAYAAQKKRRMAARWAWNALRDDPRQMRAHATFAVAAVPWAAGPLVRLVESRGGGL